MSDSPSKVNPKLTPKDGTHSTVCVITFPEAMSFINDRKYMKSPNGITENKTACLPFKYLPEKMSSIEKINPVRIAPSIFFVISANII